MSLQFALRIEMELGKSYTFTLSSGRRVKVTIYGADHAGLDAEVDGVRKTFADLNEALGEAFVAVS